MPSRFPAPWSVIPQAECFIVADATGYPLAYVHFSDRVIIGTGPDRLTKDQARRIAANIAKLPGLLRLHRGVVVALQDVNADLD